MRRGVLVGVAVVAIAGSAQAQTKKTSKKPMSCEFAPDNAAWVKGQRELLAESPTKWTNDSLRAALEAALGSDWTDAPGLQNGWMVVDSAPPRRESAFTAMVATMRSLPRGAAAPTRSSVGVAGVRGMFVLAWSDTALLRSALRRMMEAGPDEGIKPDIAVMEDRVRLMSGRKQLYGTQLHLVGKTVMPFALEDSAHVDLRRDSAVLPPLAWSVCNAKQQLVK
jgi:hypothetical protein